ncbi:hypothetical protein GCM10023200_43730 [Actinomycetospora chlora]|jgi:hypothetical protein|uniref:Uncharacterized protein n=2 Tax=Actinomycetospora chlora TaxID=663608 RepID=A0ABP9BYD2_9PSEU
MMTRMAQDASTDTSEERRSHTGEDLRALTRKVLTVAASVIRILTVVFAAILVIHVILAVAGANPANGITIFFSDLANNLTLGIGDLFLPASESLKIILNFGLAAVVWIVIGIVVSKLLNAIAP